MGTPFDGGRQRRRSRELPLTDFPEWGLDILRGLYGPGTVARAVSAQSPPARPEHQPAQRIPDKGRAVRLADYDWSQTRQPPAGQMMPFMNQLDAVSELVRYVERHFKHRH